MMTETRFAFSTIYDVLADEKGGLKYECRTAPAARKYGMGLELAEYCISDNMDDDSPVKAHFESNLGAAPVLALHAPYNELYPHAIDARVADVARERYSAAYGMCVKHGIPVMVAHANFIEALYHPAWFTERQILFWKRFLAEHDGGTVICLENMLEGSPCLIRDVVKGVNDPRLRMCLDTGHANLSGVPPHEWLRECGDIIFHLHLHNNHGPAKEGWPCIADIHGAPENGTADMESLIRAAEALPVKPTYTIECGEYDKWGEWLTRKGFI